MKVYNVRIKALFLVENASDVEQMRRMKSGKMRKAQAKKLSKVFGRCNYQEDCFYFCIQSEFNERLVARENDEQEYL